VPAWLLALEDATAFAPRGEAADGGRPIAGIEIGPDRDRVASAPGLLEDLPESKPCKDGVCVRELIC